MLEETGRAARRVGRIAARYLTAARYRLALARRERRKTRLYTDLGRACYARHRGDRTTEEPALMADINALMRESDCIRTKLTELKPVRRKGGAPPRCAKCGGVLFDGDNFCTYCGAELEVWDVLQ